MARRPPHPIAGRPARGRAGGFALVECLLVAFILAVGLLGLGALQLATVRGHAAAWTRLVALNLAGNALETLQAEARVAAPAADPGPRLARFDRDGLPAAAHPAFFAVTVTGTALGTARRCRASVTWPEDGPGSGRLTLVRLISR